MLRVHPSTAAQLDAVVRIEAAPDTAEWVGEKGWAWHQRAQADQDQEHLVVEDDAGTVIGFAVLAGLGGTPTERVVEIRRLALAADHRGAGRGRALIRTLVSRAYDAHGADRVWLDLRFDNDRARLLYESEGFVADHLVEGGMTYPDGTPCDLLVMRHRRSA